MARLVDGSIGISDEHLALRDAVRSFASRHLGSEQVRESIEAPASTRPAHWAGLAADGLLGLHLPDAVGGAGYGLLEACVVAEELGAHLAPGPFPQTVVLTHLLAGLAEGPERAHLAGPLAGLLDGTLLGTIVTEAALSSRADGAQVELTGDLGPAPDLAVADLALVRVGADWALLSAEDLGPVTDLGGLDPTRRLGTAHLARHRIPTESLLSFPERTVEALLALLVGAEACGSAAWSTRTAAEYAVVREQFGQQIGAFQGVKHRCATMLTRTEQARVLVWDAARAVDENPRADPATHALATQALPTEALLALAAAAAVAPLAAFENAKACIDTLGAIGYTWEHDATFHLKRARSATILAGTATTWREQVGRLALAGVRREVGIDLPPEAEAIRARIRAELARAEALTGPERTTFLAEHGYTAPHLPTPWGKGADAVTQLVIAEEVAASPVQPTRMIIGNWVVPTLVAHGSPEQQQRWIPASLTGEHFWCQLFSEPGAGSDLAALSTRAEKVEGGWRVNGTKIWTSGAQYASHGILLARTEPEAAKHAGISYFVLDMTAPGIDIRPIKDLTGAVHFNQVFLDDVFVPDADLVGERGEGWKLARTTLAEERVALGSGSLMGSAAEAAQQALAGSREPAQDDVRTLGRLIADAQSLNLFGLRSAIRSVTGAPRGAESSIAKLIGVRHHQEARELAVEWSGVHGLAGSITSSEGDLLWRFLNSRNESIAGGTLDVQLNIIGERLLHLPRA